MTRRPALVPCAGLVMAVVLAGCGGSTRPIDEVAASSADGAADAQGQPGGPGADSDGGGGDADVEAGGGNPGAPGDVAVFEEAGVPFGVLRDDAASACAGGVCTLAEPVVTAGDAADLGGVDECLIPRQSDIHYDPPAENGFFQEGATVTAHVDCTVEDSGSDGDGGSGTSTADVSGPASTDKPQG